jgi:GWxTD domain-containing protein
VLGFVLDLFGVRRRMSRSLVLLLVLFSSLAVPAQPRNPEEQPRKVKQELKKAYVEWINDVDPILTQAERDAWKKLQLTTSAKNLSKRSGASAILIQTPKRTSSSSSFTSAHFSSGKPGRLTDRGRIYIKFGKPDEIESHPGEYQIQVRIHDQVSGQTIAPSATFTIAP